MKKRPALLAAVFVALLVACPNPSGGNGGDEELSPDRKTRICFINNNDFSAALYSDSARLITFAEVGANAESQPVETASNPGAVFYVRYHILIDNVALPYDGPGLAVRIDAEKLNRVSVPLLSELDADELTNPIASQSHIKIQNSGASSLVLRRGAYEEIPQGADSSIVNSGETAHYAMDGGPVSNYSFLKNTVAPLAFPPDLTDFAPGHLYSLKFDGTTLILLADKPITIAQALMIQAPENISAKSLANGHIALAWDRVGTETGYVVYRSESQTGPYTSAGRTDASFYTDTSVDVGNTYYYRISAVKNKVESEKSATVVSVRSEFSSLAAPQGLGVADQTRTSIRLAWQAVSDATGYKVYKGLLADAVNEYVATTASTAYTVTGLPANTLYYFAVSAVNEEEESPQSATVSATTAPSIPSTPEGMSALMTTNGNVTVTWDAVPSASSYKLFRSLNASGGFNEKAADLVETTYTDTNLLEGTTYYYKISAVNIAGESSQSDAVSITYAAPAAPASVNASLSGATVSVSWSAVPNASSYKVYRSEGYANYYTEIGTPELPSFTDNPPAAGNWSYKVSAVNHLGTSAQSSSSDPVTLTAPTPGGVSATASVLNKSITVSWTAVSIASSYNIYRSTNSGSVSGSYSGTTWPLQSDGRRKSPAIGNSATTKTRYTFTTSGEATMTINLYASSESGSDYAFVGNLNTSASMYSYYDRISGSTYAATPKVISINIPYAGTHYIEIGYGKNVLGSSGSDCAWFEISVVDEEAYQHIGEATSLSYTDSDLSAGTYYYKVSAVTAIGESSLSSSATATLPTPSAPSNLAIRVDSDTVATLAWTSVSTAVSYTVYSAEFSSGYYAPAQTGITANTVTISGLTANTTYYFAVSSVNTLGEGDKSSPVTARTASSVGSLMKNNGWTNDSLVDGGEIKMYTFPVTSGTYYYILWQDSSTATSYGSATISINARYQTSGNSISLGTGGSAMFQASETGVVLVTVTGKNAASAGTYRIAAQD
jgi:fibronectin type 3 domain-containing protein